MQPDERGYDSDGRLLRVVVRDEAQRTGVTIDQRRARAEIELAEEVPSHAEELRAALGAWLARVEREAVSPGGTSPAT